MLRNNWITGFLILSMPISLIYFLGSQMAYGQVQRRYVDYTELPEYSTLAELQTAAANETVMVRGQLLAAEADQSAPLLIYQERPLDGREVRFQEEFDLVLPKVTLALNDGEITIQPEAVEERTISHEVRTVAIGDRELTGFQAGDTVTIQGKWQPDAEGNTAPALTEVTGISGAEKAILLASVESALQQVGRARNALGILTLVSILLLVMQLISRRRNRSSDPSNDSDGSSADRQQDNFKDDKEWHQTTTESVPTI